jgi:purine-cytosine permease-like protein
MSNAGEIEAEVCPECGYTLRGLVAAVCPECGHELGRPVSERRRSAALGLYFACLIPLLETLVLIAWGVQRLLVGSKRPSTIVLAIGMSVFSVIAMGVLTRVFKARDRLFDRLRWVSAGLAVVIGVGLVALAIVRPGGHRVLLFALALFNAGVAYLAVSLKGVPVSLVQRGDES